MTSTKKSLLVTGASGFIGGRLLSAISDDSKYSVTCAVRRDVDPWPRCKIVIGRLTGDSDWSSALKKDQVIVHAAAKAHVTKANSLYSLAELRKINVEGTLGLARQAAQAGARRLIFISSIGVNGNANRVPFTEEDMPNPSDPYSHSKWEAEQGLWKIQRETGLEIVVIRPPLVYGPDAPGNFRTLVRWVSRGVPLPLGAVHNKRTLVSVDNLIDLIITCIDHPAAANEVFLAGDKEDLSTSELLRRVGNAMGRPARLVPMPAGLLQLGATVLGKKAMAQRLLGSLQVDISKARQVLGWQPPLSVDEGLRRCFRNNQDG